MIVGLGRPIAAVPGTSNQGSYWTGAIDFNCSPGGTTHKWLLANASRLGFGQTSWQRSFEWWHWQVTG